MRKKPRHIGTEISMWAIGLLLLSSIVCQGQTALQSGMPQEELNAYNLRKLKITQEGMYALGAWSLANIASGAIAAPLTTGDMRWFNTMNAIWNGANLAIAVPGIIASSHRARVMGLSYGRTAIAQHQTEKLYLINAGLDLAYIGSGALIHALNDRPINPDNRSRMRGIGESLILQGGFLLCFDWTMYLVHAHHSKALNKYTAGLAWTGTGISYRLAF